MPDTSPDGQLESSLFSLSYSLLQSKLKNLLPYLIGFEICEKAKNGTKAVGVFGFKSDSGQTLYVPVFFLNGKVKPPELLYSKNNNQFYPLNEDFAELFLKNEATRTGHKSNVSRAQIMADQPAADFRNMIIPPRTGKYTYASVIDYVKDQNDMTKKAFAKLVERNDDYAAALLRYYPAEKIAEAVISKDSKPSNKYTNPEVKIFNTGERFNRDELNKDQKQELATQGVLVVDKRPTEKKSVFAPVDLALQFTNPDETGFYPYLTEGGEIHYGFIVVRPHQLGLNFVTDDMLVVDIDTNNAQTYLCNQRDVFVKNKIRIEDYSDIYKRFEDPASVKPGFTKTYILINNKFRVSVPFKVIANFKDDTGMRRLHVELYNSYVREPYDLFGNKPQGPGDRPGSIHDLPRGNFYNHPKKDNEKILVMTKTMSDKFSIRNDIVYIPAGYKLMEIDLERPYLPSSMEGQGEESKLKERNEKYQKWLANKPGNINTLYPALMSRKVYPMTVRSNGSEYFINVKQVKAKYKNDRMAKISCVRDLGMDWKQACELIDGLHKTNNSKVEGFLKVAYTGDYPAQPVPEVPYNDEFGTPTYQGVPSQTQAPLDNSYYGDPTRQGLGVKPDSASEAGIDSDIQSAVNMANSGQKNIFDTQSIATLAKYIKPSDKIEQYLPDFLKALDELGRLIFMSQWEMDKFTEMYGKTDMPKFTEMLSDVFRNFGDIIIFLKRKAPDLNINMSEQDQTEV